MPRDLRALFSPQSVAIVGASTAPEKVGAIVLRNILASGFNGKVFPINPNYSQINDLTCYPNLASLPEIPDLVVIAIPSSGVLSLMDEIGQKGIKNAVIFTAGFKEIGGDGVELEKSLISLADKYQVNLLGPNCLGFANNDRPINVTFGQVVSEKGNLRLATQSGAIAASLFDWCQSTKLGYSQFITIGNKAVINENDVLDYWYHLADTPSSDILLSHVSPIGLYLESISRGQDFVRIAKTISLKNPIFALKPGKSPAAAKAMQSHTGAIAGEDNVLTAAFKEAGIIRCPELSDFFDLAKAFSWEDAPNGPKVAVISNAGGPAVLSTDTIQSVGLELAVFSDPTKQKLSASLPKMASYLNPVDVLGDALADRFGEALDAVLSEDTVDSAVVILTPQLMTQIDKTAEIIGQIAKKHPKPILCAFIGGGSTATGQAILDQNKIPSYPFPENAIKALSRMWQWRSWVNEHQNIIPENFNADQIDSTQIKNVLFTAKGNQQTALNNFQANEVVRLAGINTPDTQAVKSLDEAAEFTNSHGWPIALKLSSSKVLHKADVGGVITNINGPTLLSQAWQNLSDRVAKLDPVVNKDLQFQIQKDIGSGIEVIIGARKDTNFGSVVLFGAGGKFAELIADRNLHLAPLDLSQATKLISESKIATLLKGYRGDDPYPLEPIAQVICRLSQIIENHPEIQDIEINPLIIKHDAVWAVDSKIILMPDAVKPRFTIPTFKTAKVISHQILASKFHHFVFQSAFPLNVKPGQFISVKVGDTRINAYSLAALPKDDHFELMVDIGPGGVGSQYFEKLKEGDQITYLNPAGIFIFHPDDGAEKHFFLGTGSGITPLKTMIEDLLLNQKTTKEVTLYFGLRFEEDVFWADYFDSLAKDHPNFHFKLVLSKPSDSYTGLRGHLTDALKNEIIDASSYSVYLCGNHQMIQDATQILLDKGCPQSRIYHEKFY